jgi:RNA polymerase sigma factor (sigma-70 family)
MSAPATHERLDAASLLTHAEPIITAIVSRFRFRRRDKRDASQEAHLALIEALPTFDPSRGSLHAFVSAIARNKLIDYKRHLAAKHRTMDELPAVDELIASRGAESISEDVICCLTVKQAVLLHLWFVADDNAELAGWLGCSVACVSERLSRLRRRLSELAASN